MILFRDVSCTIQRRITIISCLLRARHIAQPVAAVTPLLAEPVELAVATIACNRNASPIAFNRIVATISAVA